MNNNVLYNQSTTTIVKTAVGYVQTMSPLDAMVQKINPNKLQAISTMLYMPLAEQIAALISNDTRRGKLMTLMDRESEEPGVREDFFDGNMYKKQKEIYILRFHYILMDLDLFAKEKPICRYSISLF